MLDRSLLSYWEEIMHGETRSTIDKLLMLTILFMNEYLLIMPQNSEWVEYVLYRIYTPSSSNTYGTSLVDRILADDFTKLDQCNHG